MIGFIGGGNMAEAIIRGLVNAEKREIVVSDPRAERLRYLKKNYSVATTKSNSEVLRRSEVVILAVKPQNIGEVITEIAPLVDNTKLIVSIAAGIRLSRLTEALGTERVVRVMPNTPAFVGEAMSVLSPAKGVKKTDLNRVLEIFNMIGTAVVLDEEKMDVVTALSGSGPAFVSYFIECMAEAGVRMGLSFDDALNLTIKTFIGTCRMIEEGTSVWELKKMVTSPGGTTAEGLYAMEVSGLKGIIKSAIEAATLRAEELSRR